MRVNDRLTLLLLLAALAAGCGDDIIAVKGRVADTAPQAGSFHSVFGTHAFDLLDLPQVTDASGNFSVTYGDGTTFSGHLDATTGAFSATLALTQSFTTTITDEGTLTLLAGQVVSAKYLETRDFADGTDAHLDCGFTWDGSTLHLDARERERGLVISSDTTSFSSELQLDEVFTLPATFVEHVSTVYGFQSAGYAVSQQWDRDDLATDVAPDRTASFQLKADGSGSGSELFQYDLGITQTFVITISTNGAYTSSVTFEDPGTAVSPDAQGIFSVDPNYVGSGTWVARYDDGSRESILEQYYLDGSVSDDFTFDDASTTFTPDLEGRNFFYYDGSGYGFWNIHGPAGVIATCTYSFDIAGAVSGLACTPESVALPASAANVPAHPIYNRFANSKDGSYPSAR